MNKPSEALFRLIHKLSKEDIVLIRTQLSLNKEDNQYLRLFNIILFLENYNEDNIIKELKIKKAVFSVVKHELFNRIIQLLSLHNNNKSVFTKLNEMLSQIELLSNLGLVNEGFALCVNFKKIAKQHDLSAYFLIANRWQMMFLPQYADAHLREKMLEIKDENKTALEELVQLDEVNSIYFEVSSKVMNNFQTRSKSYIDSFRNYLTHPILHTDPQKLSFYSRNKLYMTKTFIYLVLSNYENAYQSEKHVWNELKSNWEYYVSNKVAEVRNAMINYANITQLSNRTEEMKILIPFYEQTISKHTTLKPYLEDYLEVYKLIFAIKTDNYSKLAKQISISIEYYEIKLNKKYIELEKTFCLTIGIGFYYMNEYEKSLEWISNNYIQFITSTPRMDIIEYSKFINLLICFEKLLISGYKTDSANAYSENLKIYYDSIRRKDKDEDYSLEILISKALQKIKPTHSTDKKALALFSLKKQLMQLIEANIPYILHINANFNLITWIDNCINILQKNQAN